MTEKTNVVFLAFRNPEQSTDIEEILSCNNCKNKTYKAIYREGVESFPQLQCAACGAIAGKFGWADT